MPSLAVRPSLNLVLIVLILLLSGANAFDEELGAMTPDSEEAAIKTQAIRQSRTSYLLLDSSKIGQTSFIKFAESDQIKLITEKL